MTNMSVVAIYGSQYVSFQIVTVCQSMTDAYNFAKKHYEENKTEFAIPSGLRTDMLVEKQVNTDSLEKYTVMEFPSNKIFSKLALNTVNNWESFILVIFQMPFGMNINKYAVENFHANEQTATFVEYCGEESEEDEIIGEM